MEETTTSEIENDIKCKGCGADLHYKPGTTSLHCQYCGAENPIEGATTEVKENDFRRALVQLDDKSAHEQITVVTCNGCAAQVTFEAHVSSEDCPFCGVHISVKDQMTVSVIQPESLLPFNIDSNKAYEMFKSWINGLWWAPNDLKKYAVQKDKLSGIYMPFWTYDADTTTSYVGRRGEHYAETYTVTVDGKQETRTRTKTHWYPASGVVHVPFDDTLVRGSNSLPVDLLEKLEPWDLENLTPYDKKYLSGFRTEKYQVDLEAGFVMAKDKMEPDIRNAIRDDIGGDEQSISAMDTHYDNITFKHVLLPVWVSSYLYNKKTYNFMINARTGEVQGDRPYSWIKIMFAVVTTITVGVALYYLFKE
ncbi:MAG: DNA helicase PriA [Flavobacteriales bacterium]|nr:DNA helicase PriA [Flavobacteriales bacterium]